MNTYVLHVLFGLLFFLFMFSVIGYVFITWIRWLRAQVRFVKPHWRSILALAGFCLGSVSALLWFVHLIHAQIIGGFQFYDPLHLKFMRMGFFSAVLGLVMSIPGKGILRVPGVVSSIAMAFLWLIAAIQE